MTHHPIKVLPDGTRVYSNYYRYKPMADEDRTNKVNKPSDPRAVRFHALWFLPLEMLPDEERQMPETRPDEETIEHKARCMCPVCRRPQADEHWKRKRQREAAARVRK